MDRTMSVFPLLHTPLTSAPNDLAICHRECAYSSCGAIDQNLVPGLNVPFIAQPLQAGECGHRN